MSAEKLRERALQTASFSDTVSRPQTANLLRDLCAEIERLEKENGALVAFAEGIEASADGHEIYDAARLLLARLDREKSS